jgi:hypothetical protein
VDKYIPLFPAGFQDAQKMGYIDKHDAPNGNLCLECGAVVGSRWLHDYWHAAVEKDGDG